MKINDSAWRMHPTQPLQVQSLSQINRQEIHHLISLYQPLVGPLGVALYLTLESLADSPQESLQHQDIFKVMNMGAADFHWVRQRLEAVGLLKTFLYSSSDQPSKYQLAVYQVLKPKTFAAFSQSSQLKTALLHYMGPEYFEQLLQENEAPSVDLQQFEEVTQPFKAIYSGIAANVNASDQNSDSSIENFKRTPVSQTVHKVINALIKRGVNHQLFTVRFMDELNALQTLYQFDEQTLYQLLNQVIQSQSDSIDYQQLHAEAKTIRTKKDTLHESAQSKEIETKIDKGATMKETSFPIEYTMTSLRERQTQLMEAYPDLREQDIQLILTTEQLPHAVFLERIKQGKGGFATNYEQKNLIELTKVVSLNPAVINFLIYYILIILNKSTLYQGDLERYANEWQQNHLEHVVDVMHYLRKQEVIRKKQVNPKRKSTTYSNYNEPIPEWMQIDNESKSETAGSDSVDQKFEQTLKARLEKLKRQEDEHA